LATLRVAEFGFFGVMVKTFTQTPLACGAPSSTEPISPARFFDLGFLTI
jgi:hypothetical protein